MADGGTRGTLTERVSPGPGQCVEGGRLDQSGGHGVLGNRSGRGIARQQHPKGRLVQMGLLRPKLVVNRQAHQVMAASEHIGKILLRPG